MSHVELPVFFSLNPHGRLSSGFSDLQQITVNYAASLVAVNNNYFSFSTIAVVIRPNPITTVTIETRHPNRIPSTTSPTTTASKPSNYFINIITIFIATTIKNLAFFITPSNESLSTS